MAKNRLIFYSIFGVYQLGAFIFTVIIDTDNTSALLSVYGYLSWFKYLSLVGVILIVVDFVWTWRDRKSTRLNSSHQIISYAVFCLKKKKTIIKYNITLFTDVTAQRALS